MIFSLITALIQINFNKYILLFLNISFYDMSSLKNRNLNIISFIGGKLFFQSQAKIICTCVNPYFVTK